MMMNLEAGDTRRLEHLFAEIKNIAPDRGVSGFLGAWSKLLMFEISKQKTQYEPPSKVKAVEPRIVFLASDRVERAGQPGFGVEGRHRDDRRAHTRCHGRLAPVRSCDGPDGDVDGPSGELE
jgi:hypothetical protein